MVLFKQLTDKKKWFIKIRDLHQALLFWRHFKCLISPSIFCFVSTKSCYFQKQEVKSDYLFQRSIWHCLSIYHVYLHLLKFWSMNSCQSFAVRWSQHCHYPEWSQSSKKITKLISYEDQRARWLVFTAFPLLSRFFPRATSSWLMTSINEQE